MRIALTRAASRRSLLCTRSRLFSCVQSVRAQQVIRSLWSALDIRRRERFQDWALWVGCRRQGIAHLTLPLMALILGAQHDDESAVQW